MKGGKGKSKDASQWEPDDDLQAVSDIQDQHVCVRTCCVRWKSIVVSLIGVGKILARKEHQICFAPMLTGSTVWTFHLQYEGWKGQKQRCIAMGARWWLAGRFGYSRSTCMCSHLLRALNINSCFSNWWWKNCSKKRASNLLCTHADRIYSLDLPSSIWRVERVKPKMHRNGCKGALDRCFSVVSLRKVNFLKPDSCKTSQALHVQGIYSIDDVELVLSQPNHEKFERHLYPDRFYKTLHMVSKVERARAKMHHNSSLTTCQRRLCVFWIVHTLCQNIPFILLQILYLA